MKYDPLKTPDAAGWLKTEEMERLIAIENYHKKAGIVLPNIKVHCGVHVIVENQLAEGFGPTVRALDRLMAGGLDRHDSAHAIGCIISNHFFSGLQSNAEKFDKDAYSADLNRLTAESWREEYTDPDDDKDEEDDFTV